jgi:hypothetical protein
MNAPKEKEASKAKKEKIAGVIFQSGVIAFIIFRPIL